MFIALGVVAFYSQRTHANHCNPSNLAHQFTLILLFPTRNIKRKIKIFHPKPKIGKISKNFQNLHFTPESLTWYKQKQYHHNWQKQTKEVRKIQVFIANQI